MVFFCSSDLAETSVTQLSNKRNPQAIRCVHEVSKISILVGSENTYNTIFMISAIIVAYKLFMNGVDGVGKVLSKNPIRWKGIRFPMTLFALTKRLAAIIVFSICQKLA